MPYPVMCSIFNMMHINIVAGSFCMLLASSAVTRAQAQLSGEFGLQQQRWLENKGAFVSESGLLPRATLATVWQKTTDTSWQAAVSVYAGDVVYRGVNQNSQVTVNSHTSYQGLDVQLGHCWQLSPAVQAGGGLALSGWRRDIYNPLQARDQSEIYRVVLLQGGLGYKFNSRLGFGLDVNYPIWARVEALLGEYGFERSPVLQLKGRVSPGVSVAWRLEDDLALRLQWSRVRFASSAPQSVGNVLVQQPASQLDAVYFMLAKAF